MRECGQVQIGVHVRAARLAHGLTLDDVSAHTGVTKSHLSRIENGLANVTLATLDLILAAVGCELRVVRRA